MLDVFGRLGLVDPFDGNDQLVQGITLRSRHRDGNAAAEQQKRALDLVQQEFEVAQRLRPAERLHPRRPAQMVGRAAVRGQEVDGIVHRVPVAGRRDRIVEAGHGPQRRIDSPKEGQRVRPALADVLGNTPELGRIRVLGHEWTQAELHAESAGIGLEGERFHQHAAQTEEPGLPHRLDDSAGQPIESRKSGSDQGACERLPALGPRRQPVEAPVAALRRAGARGSL